jgi:hypothetical protein
MKPALLENLGLTREQIIAGMEQQQPTELERMSRPVLHIAPIESTPMAALHERIDALEQLLKLHSIAFPEEADDNPKHWTREMDMHWQTCVGAVTAEYGITPSRLRSKSRASRISDPRRILVWIFSNVAGISRGISGSVARRLGQDPSNIRHQLKSIGDMPENHPLKQVAIRILREIKDPDSRETSLHHAVTQAHAALERIKALAIDMT